MSLASSLELSLLVCNKCTIVFQYYDYLSHIEICNFTHNVESVNDNDNDNEDNTFGFDGDDEDETETETVEDINFSNDFSNNFARSTSVNLYNPMLNRRLYNNNEYDNLSSILSTINIHTPHTNTNTNNNSNYVCNLHLHSIKTSVIIDSYCVICMNTYDIGTEFYLMKCMHAFCIECTEKWFALQSFCPLCKTEMKN